MMTVILVSPKSMTMLPAEYKVTASSIAKK